jgi:hypothetical protein
MLLLGKRKMALTDTALLSICTFFKKIILVPKQAWLRVEEKRNIIQLVFASFLLSVM